MKPYLKAMIWVPAIALVSCGNKDGSDRETQGGSGILTAGETEPGQDAASDSDSDSKGSDSDSQGSASGASDTASGGDTKFDIMIPPDGSLGCGGGGDGGNGGAPDFSYIWIANSNESTVSKIDTQTMVEEGRYITRPDMNGNPSRTSVNLNGDMAIANRSGGVTMIAALADNCPDPNNTSTGPGDVKAWQDGCVLWHTPFAYASQRPVAWTPGTWNDGTCRYDDTKLWTSGANGTIDVILIDGETGMVEQTIPIPGVAPNFYGIYGAASDADGNFWGSQLGSGQLVNVSLTDFSVRTWAMAASGYGMTVDHLGQVWTCSGTVARFDVGTETWQTAAVGGQAGCMEDGNGVLWLANDPMVGIDINTMAVVQTIDLPAYVHGISIDFFGYVWGPAIYDDEAYRVDPATGIVDTITGLNYPYTYSDMTGFALSNAGTPDG